MKKTVILLISILLLVWVSDVKAGTTSRVLILDQGANVRTGPGTQNTKITSLNKMAYYNLVSDQVYSDTNNHKGCSKDWYHLYYNGVADGYICGEHVQIVVSHSTDDVAPQTDCEKELSTLGFPSSYWGGLCRLKADHPQWQFVADKTNSNWADAIKGESACGWNLIYNSEANQGFIDKTCTKYGNTYVGILPNGIAYYMDPRNYFSERYIFQFLKLQYDASFASIYPSGVNYILKNAAFYKYHLNLQHDLSTMISSAGAELNVNPVFTSARILQELGSKETLYNLYSGVYTGNNNEYYGYYNFYNIGVSDSCVKNYGTTYCGLKYAKNSGWNSVDAAIKGGMNQINKYYLNQNQYSLYYQKFNVLGSNSYSKYSHQYMTNINAPSSESVTMYNTYTNLNEMENAFVFYIPVFNNMSETIDNTGNGAIPDDNPDETPVTIPIYTIVTSAGYKYSQGKISGVSLETNIKTIKESLEAISGSSSVIIRNQQGTIMNGDSSSNCRETKQCIGTGYTIEIKNSSSSEKLTVIINGDTSGDGIIDALDLGQVQKNILKTYDLSGSFALAGDTNDDNKIDALDLGQIQKAIVGKFKITQ
jgi:beta-N-acetylglucosaminidase